VPIGVVADMRFQDGKTLVELRVDPTRACIQDLTLARMDRLLVTGQVTVELEGYGPEGRRLSPGAFIKPKEDPLQALTASLPDVVDRAVTSLQRLDAVLERVERLLGDDNLARSGRILANLERASAGIADEVVPEALALLQKVRQETVPEAGVMLRTATEAAARLQGIEPELAAFSREATALLASLRGPSQTALASLRQALDDVRGLARQLKLAPDSLLFGVQRPAAPAGGER
jgi:ABC-type transporter Mla subunit MlaD